MKIAKESQEEVKLDYHYSDCILFGFSFDTAENEPANNLQNFAKNANFATVLLACEQNAVAVVGCSSSNDSAMRIELCMVLPKAQ